LLTLYWIHIALKPETNFIATIEWETAMMEITELPHLNVRPGMQPDEVKKLVKPYLSWELMATSQTSTKLLIGEPVSAGDVGVRSLLVLDGLAASTWLRHHAVPKTLAHS
jgi:hypothetical protein